MPELLTQEREPLAGMRIAKVGRTRVFLNARTEFWVPPVSCKGQSSIDGKRHSSTAQERKAQNEDCFKIFYGPVSWAGRHGRLGSGRIDQRVHRRPGQLFFWCCSGSRHRESHGWLSSTYYDSHG